jgi:putative spermidine/putrescine transport system ATP-binding protein
VYERPATGFVAGFVGTSNLLSGEAARTITGSPEPITVRPEKIRIAPPDEQPGPHECLAYGHVRDVAYIGALTKYIVALDPGGELLVFQQNLTTSSMEALQVKGRPVRLIWSRSNNRPVQTGGRGEGAGAEGSQAPEEGEA